MQELLLKTTQQEMIHLKQEKGKLDGAMTELQFRQRKLQKKLDACNSSLKALKDDGAALDTKIDVLDDSLTTFQEAEDKNTSLIEILCEKNPLVCLTIDSVELTERLLEMNHGEVRCGSLNELIDILTHPELCKPSYRSTFLLTFQSFTDPLYLLSRLLSQFSLSDERILTMITETNKHSVVEQEVNEMNIQKLTKLFGADPKTKAFSTISARRANELMTVKPQPFKVPPKRPMCSAQVSPDKRAATDADLASEGSGTTTSSSVVNNTNTNSPDRDQDDQTDTTGNLLTEDVVSSRAKTPTQAEFVESPSVDEKLSDVGERPKMKKTRSKGKTNRRDVSKKQGQWADWEEAMGIEEGGETDKTPRKKKAKEKKNGKKKRPGSVRAEEEVGKGAKGEEGKPKERGKAAEEKESEEPNAKITVKTEPITSEPPPDTSENKAKATSEPRVKPRTRSRSRSGDIRAEIKPKSETSPKTKEESTQTMPTTSESRVKPRTRSRSRSGDIKAEIKPKSESIPAKEESKKAKSGPSNSFDKGKTKMKAEGPKDTTPRGEPKTPDESPRGIKSKTKKARAGTADERVPAESTPKGKVEISMVKEEDCGAPKHKTKKSRASTLDNKREIKPKSQIPDFGGQQVAYSNDNKLSNSDASWPKSKSPKPKSKKSNRCSLPHPSDEPLVSPSGSSPKSSPRSSSARSWVTINESSEAQAQLSPGSSPRSSPTLRFSVGAYEPTSPRQKNQNNIEEDELKVEPDEKEQDESAKVKFMAHSEGSVEEPLIAIRSESQPNLTKKEPESKPTDEKNRWRGVLPRKF